MQWFADPPCTSFAIERESTDLLELTGPGPAMRAAGGVFAAVGGGMAAHALRIAARVPGPFKLVPVIAAAGAGAFGATEAVSALARASVLVERRKGVTFRWHARPMKPRERFVAFADVAGLEVVVRTHRDSESHATEVRYQLVLVTNKGEAIAFEEFLTRTQCELRLELVRGTLGFRR